MAHPVHISRDIGGIYRPDFHFRTPEFVQCPGVINVVPEFDVVF
jgi:hypothetical protein